MELPVVAKVCLKLSTFGSVDSVQELDVVKVKFRLGSYHFNAKLIIHDNVETKLHNPGILQIHKRFKENGVQIADK